MRGAASERLRAVAAARRSFSRSRSFSPTVPQSPAQGPPVWYCRACRPVKQFRQPAVLRSGKSDFHPSLNIIYALCPVDCSKRLGNEGEISLTTIAFGVASQATCWCPTAPLLLWTLRLKTLFLNLISMRYLLLLDISFLGYKFRRNT